MQNQAIRFIQDVLHIALRAVLGVFISAPVAGLAAAGITEVVAGIAAHHFFASAAAHAYALMIGLVVAYAVALTYGVVECLRGATAVARWLAHEASNGRG